MNLFKSRKKEKQSLSVHEEIFTPEIILENVIQDYTTQKSVILMKMKKGMISKEDFLEDVRNHVEKLYEANNETTQKVLDEFEKFVFSYSKLTPLIEDPDITDIRCVSYDNIRIKKRGVRMDSGITFQSKKEFREFVSAVATKNGVGISNMTAIQRFVDMDSTDYILRFTVCMPLVNTYDEPYLCIRKTPKDFPEVKDLIQAGMLDKKTAELLIKRFCSGSTLIVGGNSAGKTTLLNALKEELPAGMSVMVEQQADELTTKRHPDMMFLHSLPETGESSVSYDLENISIAGLTLDVDAFIIGEVKGDEAMYLLNAAYTGQICAATIHGPSADKGIDKLVDYAMYKSRYTRNELMKMMACFSTVVFVKDYKVMQIYEVAGWNEGLKELDYKPLYVHKGGEEK